MFFLHAWYIERFVREQRESLKGFRFHDAFSVSKHELYLQWMSSDQQMVNWRMHWDAGQFFISIPEEVNIHARKRLKQFHALEQASIRQLVVHPNERSFEIEFDNDQILLIQCHGPNAKLSLWFNNSCQGLFHSNKMSLPAWSNLRNGNAFFNEEAKTYPWFKSLLAIDPEKSLQEWKKVFLSSPIFLGESKIGFDIVPWAIPQARCFDSISDAWSNYSSVFLKKWHFEREKNHLLEQWNKRITELARGLKSAEIKFSKLSEAQNYRHYGDLIMSHLWQLGDKAKEVELDDYLSGTKIRIPLKSDLSAQENAERYYRKAKNQTIELTFAKKRISELKAKLGEARKSAEELNHAADWASLKPFLIAAKEKAVEDERSPYHQFEFMGFPIFVGKSATDNDELTLRIAKKDDLWLHARDVAGSHVIVRQKPGQSFPEAVVEVAAALAAWFSKRKNESLCPVIFTQKKYIRKRKGMHAGQVMVEKERVVIVKPESPDQLFGK